MLALDPVGCARRFSNFMRWVLPDYFRQPFRAAKTGINQLSAGAIRDLPPLPCVRRVRQGRRPNELRCSVHSLNRNYFFMDELTIVSFSGGRTSAMMLYLVLQAHDGKLPASVRVCFTNTGKEREETLNFVEACSRNWSVPIAWLEYAPDSPDKLRVTSFENASRSGEPFASLIDSRKFLPNPVTRFCTTELKIRTVKRFAMSHLGWSHWQNAIGLRADEPMRVAKIRNQRERWETIAPLAKAGITKADVIEFWAQQPFDLQLTNANGKTPHENCDLCFLKGADLIAGLIREEPTRADWWIDQEAKLRGKTQSFSSCRFRSDRPDYAAIKKAVREQRDAFDGRDHLNDCYCHD